MVGWNIPEDRPAVKTSPVLNPRRANEDSERSQLAVIEAWLESDDKTLPYMTCVLLENMIEGLIHGGRYLYGWANGEGGQAPVGMGMPELEVLQECNIDVFVQRNPMKSKGRDVFFTLKTEVSQHYIGFDSEELTRQPRTIGPRQSGAPCDIMLTMSPAWITDLTDRQREYVLFSALRLIVPDELRYLSPWKVISPDIVLDSSALEIYGAEMPEGIAVLQASKRHVQTYLPGMTPAERRAALELLLRENGMQAYKDGRVINADGTVEQA